MDTYVSPVTRDYVYGSDGTLARDPARGLANAIYLRLMTPLGSWWADPTLGSRLHELQREKDVPRVVLLARQYCEQALKPLLDDNRARRVQVEAQRTNASRMVLLVQVTDAGGRDFVFEYPVKVS